MKKLLSVGTTESFERVHKNPFLLFDQWFKAYTSSSEIPSASHESVVGGMDRNAMCLSTCGSDGFPASRMVLLKKFTPDSHCFMFFTNYQSRKATQIRENPNVALNFYWGNRQVRVEGVAEKVSDSISDSYFNSRPRESRIGAIASLQSQPIESSDGLLGAFDKVSKRFEGVDDIPRPETWGGFKVTPRLIEFWEEGPSRLHTRLQFTRPSLNDQWTLTLLYP